MKVLHNLYGKKLLSISILLLISLNILSAFNVNLTNVSAVDSPYIAVVPENTVDSTLRPGMNLTVSIYTDYTGLDVTSYQFTLQYDPNVLHGVEVVNGDLIVGGSAQFVPGKFNNTSGELSLTVGYYYTAGEVNAGPGTLANVTFTVVGKGTSNITIGDRTKLIGWDLWLWTKYDIIDAATMPTHIQHGSFDNRYSHDVAVNTVTVPDKAAIGSVVSVGVEIVNFGLSTETANIAVYYDSTYLDSKNVTLLVGENKTVSFNWNTTGIAEGVYTVNATATVSGDEDQSDNWNTTPILISLHNVAVGSVTAPHTYFSPEFRFKAAIGSLVYINVTVANIGGSDEVANVTIRYDTSLIDFNETVEIPAQDSTFVQFYWNTTNLAQGNYTINATAIIPGDLDPSDNWKTATILIVEHDVAVTSILVTPDSAIPGDIVSINVTVANIGASTETANITVYYDSTYLDSKNVTLLVGENKTVSFNWNTTGIARGVYTVNATATVPGDEDQSDNWNTTTIPISVHDVELMSITASPWVEAGKSAVFWAAIINLGLYNEAFEVKVAISNDTTVVETQTQNITLNALASDDVLFSWMETAGVAPDSYTIKVEAILATDEDLTNNNLIKSILVIVPPVASFTFSPTELVVDEVATFNASSSYDADPDGEIVSYAWNFGDGTQKLFIDANLTDITTHTYTATGTYTVILTVTDKEGLNDTATTDVKVALHDIAITEVTVSSDAVKIGELVYINVTVKNNGSEKESFNVTVNYDGHTIGTQSISELASGASKSLTFSWDTSNVEAGTYTIEAVATILTGETNTADNILTHGPVTIEKPSAPDILPYAVAGGAAIIIIVAAAIYLLKIRKPT